VLLSVLKVRLGPARRAQDAPESPVAVGQGFGRRRREIGRRGFGGRRVRWRRLKRCFEGRLAFGRRRNRRGVGFDEDGDGGAIIDDRAPATEGDHRHRHGERVQSKRACDSAAQAPLRDPRDPCRPLGLTLKNVIL
jgi:hypothetical protein